MKTTVYNGSRKVYLCPAINITEIKVETFMLTPSQISGGGNDNGNGSGETKRRRSIFDNDVDAMEERGIW